MRRTKTTVLASAAISALCLERSFAQDIRLYNDFRPADFPGEGCPLAGTVCIPRHPRTPSTLTRATRFVRSPAIWSIGSQYPNANVNGPKMVKGITFGAPSNCTEAEFNEFTSQVLTDYADGIADAAGHNRLMFHEAALYSAVSGPGGLGGPNGGWLRFPNNLAFPENAGLQGSVAYVEEMVKKYPCISYADATSLIGAVVTEAAGGPSVAWMPGRSDANITPENPLIVTRLPDGTFTSAGVVYFYTQMGMTDREMAVLNGGGHSIGGAGASSSGWNGSFTPAAGSGFPTPKNLYFVQTFENEWDPQVTLKSDGKPRLQYVLVGADGQPTLSIRGGYVIRIPSDVAILLDGREPTVRIDRVDRVDRAPTRLTLPDSLAHSHFPVLQAWAYSYYKDEELFMTDYGRVLQRISQLGAGQDW